MATTLPRGSAPHSGPARKREFREFHQRQRGDLPGQRNAATTRINHPQVLKPEIVPGNMHEPRYLLYFVIRPNEKQQFLPIHQMKITQR